MVFVALWLFFLFPNDDDYLPSIGSVCLLLSACGNKSMRSVLAIVVVRKEKPAEKKQNKTKKVKQSHLLLFLDWLWFFFLFGTKEFIFFFSPHLFGRTFSMEIKNKTKYKYKRLNGGGALLFLPSPISISSEPKQYLYLSKWIGKEEEKRRHLLVLVLVFFFFYVSIINGQMVWNGKRRRRRRPGGVRAYLFSSFPFCPLWWISFFFFLSLSSSCVCVLDYIVAAKKETKPIHPETMLDFFFLFLSQALRDDVRARHLSAPF